ncbi:MarR family transcriptional regulator [Novosphingobium sp. ZN18A2]|uniref:MarR family winged helix-turn-helix transcriptional regulator n=1 Tax=Novosphingobium sp. ZN18A2 TaxID=3079861 RepID=UPI0030CB6714
MDKDLSRETLRALRRVLRITELGGKTLVRATGLTPSQLLVLQEIGRRGEVTPSTVANTLQFSHATITALVDRLVSAGFVTRQRSERDKRQVLLAVTAAGEKMILDAPDMLQAQFRERFRSLPYWEQAMLLSSVERLGELLGAQGIDAAPLLDAGAIDRTYQQG